MGLGRVWVPFFGRVRGPALILFLFYVNISWNAPAISLVLPAFDDIGSLGSPSRQVFYPSGSRVPPWMTASCFLAENREVYLKPITFSSLLLFRVFMSFLFS